MYLVARSISHSHLRTGLALCALLWHSALSLKVYYKTRTAPFPHSKRPPFLTSPRPKLLILSLLSCTITERFFPLVHFLFLKLQRSHLETHPNLLACLSICPRLAATCACNHLHLPAPAPAPCSNFRFSKAHTLPKQ